MVEHVETHDYARKGRPAEITHTKVSELKKRTLGFRDAENRLEMLVENLMQRFNKFAHEQNDLLGIHQVNRMQNPLLIMVH